MSITQITTHNIDALARLLYQYKNSSNLQGLITGLFGTQVQELEDALWPLFDRLNIDTQEGTQLDGIGSIVGQTRMGLSDDLYRIWLKAKIAKNVSEGDIERVISIWQLFNPDATTIEIREAYPAEVDIYSNAALTVDSGYFDSIFIFMQQVVVAGVAVGYVAVFDSDNPFGFIGDTLSSGFGDTGDAEIGGELGYIELS